MNCGEGITGPADDILIGRGESDVIIEMWTGLITEITALYRDTVTGLSPLTTPVTGSILPNPYHFNRLTNIHISILYLISNNSFRS